MSKKPVTHRVKIAKYNRHPGYQQGGGKKRWWADCSCGRYNGFFDKHEAQVWRDGHIANMKDD